MLSVSGCGLVAIPPALTIASYAADGISFLVTGKSVTDHAVSEVADADCAMWRMIKMQNPCLDENGEAETLIAFGGDLSNPLPPMNEPDAGWGELQPGAVEDDAAPGRIEPAGETVAAVSAGPTAAGGRWPVSAAPAQAAAQPEPEAAPNVLPAAGPAPHAAPTPAVQQADAAGGGEIMAVAGGEVDEPDPVQLAAIGPAAGEPVPAVSAVGERRFLVIGSFADRANAERLARAHPRLVPLIAPAMVSGGQVYRVVTEAAAEDAELMRKWLARNGFAEAWPIAACTAGAVAPGCLAVPGSEF